jgi:hypothetical protein
MESEPCFCYSGQVNEIRVICHRLFVMSPVHSCGDAGRISSAFERWRHSVQPNIRQEHPIFFFVKDHVKPVPANFWPTLEKMGAILVCIDMLAEGTLERTGFGRPPK